MRLRPWTYSTTSIPSGTLPTHGHCLLRNLDAACLVGRSFDGVKMDIEGSEGGLLDGELLPECRKLVLEYHLSRDPSIEHLKRRLDVLHRRFRTVRYPAELDRLIAAGGVAKTFYDRFIHCVA